MGGHQCQLSFRRRWTYKSYEEPTRFPIGRAAQRQLNWILGVNPHNASTVEGIGHNHPQQFVNGNEFRPATPRLPGAVMNGIGGTVEDQPDLYD